MQHKLKKVAGKLVSVSKSGYAKVAGAGTSLMVAGAAMAQDSTPGAAIAGEMSGGKADMGLVIAACAILIGVLLVWAYTKRAAK